MTMRSILLGASNGFNAVCGVSVAAEPVEDDDQVLFDTTGVVVKGFRAGFGCAVFVEFRGKRLRLDLGSDADTLQHCPRAAGVKPAQLDAVAVSHNHFGHRAGLS